MAGVLLRLCGEKSRAHLTGAGGPFKGLPTPDDQANSAGLRSPDAKKVEIKLASREKRRIVAKLLLHVSP
jgi:hypothetical protein